MSFPTINFKHTNTESDSSLQTLVEQKLASLEKFIGDAPTLYEIEFERVTDSQHGDIFRVEANVQVNGKFYRAEATMDSFEKAIDEVRDELDKELRRSRDKEDTLLKRGGRKIKNLLRWGSSEN